MSSREFDVEPYRGAIGLTAQSGVAQLPAGLGDLTGLRKEALCAVTRGAGRGTQPHTQEISEVFNDSLSRSHQGAIQGQWVPATLDQEYIALHLQKKIAIVKAKMVKEWQGSTLTHDWAVWDL